MRINLKDYYKNYYTEDYYVDIPDEVAFWLDEFDRMERRWKERMQYHFSTMFSLDCDDGIESLVTHLPISAEKAYLAKIRKQAVYEAIDNLSEKQAVRIYQHYILGLSKAEIARREGSSVSSVKDGIKRGMNKMRRQLEKII